MTNKKNTLPGSKTAKAALGRDGRTGEFVTVKRARTGDAAVRQTKTEGFPPGTVEIVPSIGLPPSKAKRHMPVIEAPAAPRGLVGPVMGFLKTGSLSFPGKVVTKGESLETMGLAAPRKTKTDLAALDAHEPVPDDDAPELTDAEIATGELRLAGKKIGRPKADRTKQAVSLRLDPEIIAHFQAAGAGWQTRINDALLRIVKRAR